jgi:N-acetylglutamate synthase
VTVLAKAEPAAQAFASAYERISAALPDGWMQRAPGAFAAVTMVPVPTLNGVTVLGADSDPEIVTALLDRVAATGMPHSLRLRPGTDPRLDELASARRMTRARDIPLMVMDDTARLEGERDGDLRISLLTPNQAGRHAGVAAAGFGAPETDFRRLITPDVLRLPGVRCYLGEIAREPVSTGLGFGADDHVGIFNIATVPAHRAHGYGTAITTRIVRDAATRGATWAWLQSSPSGHNVYERIGFRTVETWRFWIADG